MSTDGYRIGDLVDFRDTDPAFATEEEAMRAAEKWADPDKHSPFEAPPCGLWHTDGELLMIYYQSRWFD